MASKGSLFFAFGSVIQSVYDKSGQQVQAIDGKNKPPNKVFNAHSQRTAEVVRLRFAIDWAHDAARMLLVLPGACRSQQVANSFPADRTYFACDKK